MAYWWHIKRYKEEPIRVKENVGIKAQAAWLAGQETIALPGNIVVASSSISAVEPSTEVMREDNIYKLSDGTNVTLKPYGKGRPLLAPDFEENGVKHQGGVLWNWYKKNIDKREWGTYYAKISSYYRIDDGEGGCWVALRLIEEEGSEKPQYMIECTKEEVRHLDVQISSNL